MLRNLIENIFVNKTDQTLLLLQKYELRDIVSNFSKKITEFQNSDIQKNKNVIGALASTFLTRLNSVLEKIELIDEKEELEYILSEISNEFIHQLILKEGISKEYLLTEIRDSLITTCEANDWDIDALLKKTKIDLLHTLSVKSSTSLETNIKKNVPGIFYYEWLENNERLNELAYDLKDQKIIKSTEEFKKLFSMHNGEIQVKIDDSKTDFIIILFDQLKVNGLIKTHGTRGHFLPLKMYCVDFEKNVLIKSDPKRIKESVKRNVNKYEVLLKDIKRLIGGN